MRCFIQGNPTLSDKEKQRLSRKWGAPPSELEIGFLVNRFNQTPFQLGLSEDKLDLALIYRSLSAAHAYSLGEKAYTDASELSIDDGLLVGKLDDAVSGKRRVSKEKMNRVMK